MAPRPTDWHPLAASDPTPGDPEAIHTEATRLQSMGKTIRDQIAMLHKIGAADNIKGQYADKVKSTANDLAGKLDKTASRYEKVGGHLHQWAGELAGVQTKSGTALAHAQDAQRRIDQNQPAPTPKTAAGSPPPPPPTPSQQAAITAQQNALLRATDDLNEARQMLSEAVDHRDKMARQYKHAIADDNDDDLKDSWWDGVKDFIDGIAPFLKILADILSWIGTALAIVALFIPGLNIIAAAVIIATLLIHVALAAAGDGSWLDVGLDVFSLLTFGAGGAIGRVLGKSGRLTEEALKDAAPALAKTAGQEFGRASQLMKNAGRVLNNPLATDAEKLAARADMSAGMKALWAARKSASADALALARGAEGQSPGLLSILTSGGKEAAGIKMVLERTASRFPGFAGISGKPPLSFRAGQYLFAGSTAFDWVNHAGGGSDFGNWVKQQAGGSGPLYSTGGFGKWLDGLKSSTTHQIGSQW